MEAVVKDFQELDNKNVLSEEKYQVTLDALNDAYLYDSDTVLLVTVVIDCSQSVQEAGAFPVYNGFLKSFKSVIEQEPEACANIKLCVIRYGKDVEVVTGFTGMYDYHPDEEICYNMGTTDSAKALTKAFDLTKQEMCHQGKDLGKKLRGGLVFHITDGLPTSLQDEMMQMVKKYDEYSRSNGKRRIKIFSATPDMDVAKRLSSYSDQTFLTEDYDGLTDAVKSVALLGSVYSSLPMKVDPVTGEMDIDLSQANAVEAEEGVVDIIPRTLMNVADMW